MANSMKLAWGAAVRNVDGSINTHCNRWLYLDITVTCATSALAYQIMDEFEKELNELIEGEYTYECGKLLRCPSEEDNKFFDCMSFTKEYDGVTEQRKELYELAQRAKRIVMANYR